jgi:hypothetical protein
MPVRIVTTDHAQTTIGGAQKDTIREWAGKAANLRPVMWAGVIMMTIVAGALFYFGWWTKGALAARTGAGHWPWSSRGGLPREHGKRSRLLKA